MSVDPSKKLQSLEQKNLTLHIQSMILSFVALVFGCLSLYLYNELKSTRQNFESYRMSIESEKAAAIAKAIMAEKDRVDAEQSKLKPEPTKINP